MEKVQFLGIYCFTDIAHIGGCFSLFYVRFPTRKKLLRAKRGNQRADPGGNAGRGQPKQNIAAPFVSGFRHSVRGT